MPNQKNAVGRLSEAKPGNQKRQGTGNVIQLSTKLSSPRDVRTSVVEPRSVSWPVGSIFIGNVSTNPGTLIGIGTWTAVQDGIWASIGDVDMYIWQRTA